MKRRKRLTGRKIARLKASAEGAGGRDAEGFVRWYKPAKQQVSVHLDADVLAWWRGQGRGYQTRINRALREVMMEERKREEV